MRSILITGGSGSFSVAFARRLLAGTFFDRICMFSRGEHRQAEVREHLNDDRLRWFIGDVRDRDRLRTAMRGCEIVIHAAALKRIEVGAYNATEMVRTNVMGAINVVEAAIDCGVERVVALSSDKAWQPISPYGHSKAMAEQIFLQANNASGGGTEFIVTRYGNVAGSNGSVIPKWRRILQSGEVLVPMTDPECTRFYMTMDQAVNLVAEAVGGMRVMGYQAPTRPRTDKLMIPRDLPAYRLGDLALAMGAVGWEATGLPAWEKLAEGMDAGCTSDRARRLTVDELRERLQSV